MTMANDVESQKSEIARQLQKSLVLGDTWYVIAVKWLKQWKSYVGYESWDRCNVGKESANPGPIDNTPLLQEGTSMKMKEHLTDDLDYTLLHEDGWNMLVSWYGISQGQGPLPRRVIEEGVYNKSLKVEVYPWHMQLCEYTRLDDLITIEISRSDTIGQIEQVMRQLFNIAEDKEVQLWNRYMGSMYEPLTRMHNTLQDTGLYQGQIIMIEQKNIDGTWPKQFKQNIIWEKVPAAVGLPAFKVITEAKSNQRGPIGKPQFKAITKADVTNVVTPPCSTESYSAPSAAAKTVIKSPDVTVKQPQYVNIRGSHSTNHTKTDDPTRADAKSNQRGPIGKPQFKAITKADVTNVVTPPCSTESYSAPSAAAKTVIKSPDVTVNQPQYVNIRGSNSTNQTKTDDLTRADGGDFVPEIMFDGSIRIQDTSIGVQQQHNSDMSSDEDEYSFDNFVILRFKNRHGEYNSKLLRADLGHQAVKWRFVFNNKTYCERLSKAFASIPATIDSKVSSNVVIQTEQAIKYSAFRNNIQASIQVEMDKLNVEEIAIDADEANEVLKFISVSCPELKSDKASIFLEKRSGIRKMWLIAVSDVFDMCLSVLNKSREYVKHVKQLRAALANI